MAYLRGLENPIAMRLFYHPEARLGVNELSAEESAHLSKVLRLRPGDRVTLVDGRGGWHDGQVLEAHPKRAAVEVERSQVDAPRRPRLCLAIAPTKNIDRFEFFLEKATELGVDRIVPLLCEKSERRTLRDERLEKVLVAAMKQSGRRHLPSLDALTPFSEFVGAAWPGARHVAHCLPTQKGLYFERLPKGQDATLLVGPEGDFSPEEIGLALSLGYEAASLGAFRLRTETAGLAGVQMFNLRNDL